MRLDTPTVAASLVLGALLSAAATALTPILLTQGGLCLDQPMYYFYINDPGNGVLEFQRVLSNTPFDGDSNPVIPDPTTDLNDPAVVAMQTDVTAVTLDVCHRWCDAIPLTNNVGALGCYAFSHSVVGSDPGQQRYRECIMYLGTSWVCPTDFSSPWVSDAEYFNLVGVSPTGNTMTAYWTGPIGPAIGLGTFAPPPTPVPPTTSAPTPQPPTPQPPTPQPPTPQPPTPQPPTPQPPTPEPPTPEPPTPQPPTPQPPTPQPPTTRAPRTPRPTRAPRTPRPPPVLCNPSNGRCSSGSCEDFDYDTVGPACARTDSRVMEEQGKGLTGSNSRSESHSHSESHSASQSKGSGCGAAKCVLVNSACGRSNFFNTEYCLGVISCAAGRCGAFRNGDSCIVTDRPFLGDYFRVCRP